MSELNDRAESQDLRGDRFGIPNRHLARHKERQEFVTGGKETPSFDDARVHTTHQGLSKVAEPLQRFAARSA